MLVAHKVQPQVIKGDSTNPEVKGSTQEQAAYAGDLAWDRDEYAMCVTSKPADNARRVAIKTIELEGGKRYKVA